MLRLSSVISAALISLGAFSLANAAEKPVEMAITFDDLPAHSGLPAGVSRSDIARTIIRAQKQAGAPPMYGFLNAIALKREGKDAANTLQIWRNAGNFLGNHTYSHLGATRQSPAEFAADIKKNEPYLRKYMAGENWHYLRLPYLDMGDTQAKREANHAFMRAEGYRLADVAMNFNDWDFNNAYLRCVKQDNQPQIRWLKTHYLSSFARGIARGRAEAAQIWGHDIKYVYLLHIGVLDSIMFPRVLAMVKARHIHLIPFPEAINDPVYEKNDLVMHKWGGMLPSRVAAKKHIALTPSDPSISAGDLAHICQAS